MVDRRKMKGRHKKLFLGSVRASRVIKKSKSGAEFEVRRQSKCANYILLKQEHFFTITYKHAIRMKFAPISSTANFISGKTNW